jgi:hypothetical protein
VKYGIPVATLFLLGAAFCLHRSALPSRPQEDRKSEAIPAEPVMVAETAPRPSQAGEALKPESTPRQKRPEAGPAAPAASGEPWKNLMVRLDRDLGLTVLQKEGLDRILRDREAEIRGCHEAIRKSGLLDMRHYEWQVALMKAAWYRKIDSLLDTVQHERFVAIVEQGFFNDGLAFTHEPGMTVLD